MSAPLWERVAEIFAPGGVLEDSVPEYLPRPGQQAMAAAVARNVESGGVLVVEAGTGVGKTYAYLVPALLSGHKVLLSTATKALQDQLFARDIPGLLHLLKLPVRVALLKGRNSYVCLHRLANARYGGLIQDALPLRLLAQVEAWVTATRTGDVAEVPALEESEQVLPLVTSTRENCTSSKCPRYQECFLYRARRNAMAADVVVINHHLFFADSHVRESGVAELLPTVNAVIFDEAHQLNGIGVQFLGQQWSTLQLLNLGRDVVFACLQWARGLADWQLLVEHLEMAVVDMQLVVRESASSALRLPWQAVVPEGLIPDLWGRRLARLTQVHTDLTHALQGVAEAHPELAALAERALMFQEHLERAAVPAEDGVIRWMDNGSRLRFVESPMDISQAMRNKVTGALGADSRVSWTFTSATLGPGPDLAWFVDSAGLQGASVLKVESPFDYAHQAALYVPGTFPAPSHPNHGAHVAALAVAGVKVLGGRTMVLTTTLRAMRLIAEAIRRLLPPHLGISVLVQGERSKRELLERFQRRNGLGSVLVASASFWEGVDIPGQSLQLLLIDKIPFAPPDDPLLKARCTQVDNSGGNSFREVQIPLAAVALRQGVGRLIRRESDRGVLAVCDVRLRHMAYGKLLLSELPLMRVIQDETHFHRELQELTTTSTTDQSPASHP
nr:ATP-dependent DNA helicase [uncultured Rhodoferax sp.]